ncbi:retrovirus-related pol polyprotein from transposon TNT 1-94 [Tanacetum coccineum]
MARVGCLLAHLKVSGCDTELFKVKAFCGEAMKCTIIGSGSDEMRYNFRDIKSHQVIRSRDITFADSIYGAKSGRVGAQIRVRGPKTVGASRIWKINKNTLKYEHHPMRELRDSTRTEDPPRVQGSVKRVKEEQDGNKRYKAQLVVKGFQQKQRVDYNEIPTLVVKILQIKVFSQLGGQEENLEWQIEVNSVTELIQAPRLWVLIFVEDSWNEEPCSDVHQVGDEREVEVLRSFNWPPSELITEDGVLPERVCSVAQPQVNPDSTIAQIAPSLLGFVQDHHRILPPGPPHLTIQKDENRINNELMWFSSCDEHMEWKRHQIKYFEKALREVEPHIPMRSIPRTSGFLHLTEKDGATPAAKKALKEGTQVKGEMLCIAKENFTRGNTSEE